MNSPFSFSVKNQTNNWEIVTLEVFIGSFRVEINVLNHDRQSHLTRTKTTFEGTFGKIYVMKFQEEEIAVKSYEVTEDKYPRVFPKVLREYTIMKICDLLGSGPNVSNCFGFDLFLYSNRIEFTV